MSNFHKTALTLIFASLLFFSLANFALAQETGLKKPTLQINIPTVNFGSDKGLWIGEYISGIYKYAIGIIGILAAVILMFGGLLWLTAGGNTGQVTEAKEWIKASLTGLIIALSSYMILYVINPDLTTFKSLSIENIKNVPPSTISNIRRNTAINLSDIHNGADLTKASEGFSLTPYYDEIGKTWTIGYGHALSSQDALGESITPDEAESLFITDYETAITNAKEVTKSQQVNFDNLTSARKAVLVDMAFNMGRGKREDKSGLAGFTNMWNALANNDFDKAAEEIKNSTYAGQVKDRADINAQIMASGKLP